MMSQVNRRMHSESYGYVYLRNEEVCNVDHFHSSQNASYSFAHVHPDIIWSHVSLELQENDIMICPFLMVNI